MTPRHECRVGGAGGISWTSCSSCGWQSEGFWDILAAAAAYDKHVIRATPPPRMQP
jgi:hypothetical protein